MNIDNFVQGLAFLAWLLVGAVFVILVVTMVRRRTSRPSPGMVSLVVGAIVLALVLTTLGAGLVFIEPQDRGVVVSATSPQGYRPETLQSGLHWIMPYAETIVTYPVAKQTYTMHEQDAIEARTRDGQKLLIDSSVIFAIEPDRVIDVHLNWQNRYVEELVRPLMRGMIRDVVSQYSVEEIVSTKRFELAERIKERTTERLSQNGLTFADFVLRDIGFTPEYAAAVEQKQITQQEVEKASLVVEQRKYEAEQARQTAQGQADAVVIQAEGQAKARLVQAEAEAQALQLVATSLAQNPNLITCEYVQKLAPGIQVMLVPNNSPLVLPLPTVPTTTTPALSSTSAATQTVEMNQ